MVEIENTNAKTHIIVYAYVSNISCILYQEWRDVLFMNGD